MNQQLMDSPVLDYMIRRLSTAYAIKVEDRYVSMQIYNNVYKIKIISEDRINKIINKKYKQLIKKYNLTNKWEEI